MYIIYIHDSTSSKWKGTADRCTLSSSVAAHTYCVDCKVLKRNWQARWTDFRKFESQLHVSLISTYMPTCMCLCYDLMWASMHALVLHAQTLETLVHFVPNSNGHFICCMGNRQRPLLWLWERMNVCCRFHIILGDSIWQCYSDQV